MCWKKNTHFFVYEEENTAISAELTEASFLQVVLLCHIWPELVSCNICWLFDVNYTHCSQFRCCSSGPLLYTITHVLRVGASPYRWEVWYWVLSKEPMISFLSEPLRLTILYYISFMSHSKHHSCLAVKTHILCFLDEQQSFFCDYNKPDIIPGDHSDWKLKEDNKCFTLN